MRKTFKEKLKRMMDSNMDSNMAQEKKEEFPGDLGEFESFEEFMGEFEAE